MKIRVEILETEPFAKDGTYVYNSGEIAGQGAYGITEDISTWLVRSLTEMRMLKVKE